MLPKLHDMSKIECKKALRTLELEAYAMIVSAFRAQGDLTQKKIEILKELQTVFKISIDRHKAELRRAMNDDKLYTIAKLLSHGDCVSSEWIKQSKRLIPLLPSLQSTNSTSNYYRILADQIISKAEPIFNLFPEQNQSKSTDKNKKNNYSNNNNNTKFSSKNKYDSDSETNSEQDAKEFDSKSNNHDDSENLDQNLIYLKNGYAVESKYVLVENTQPSEYVKRFESINQTEQSNGKSFLNYLIQRYKHQKEQDDLRKSQNTKQTEKTSENKSTENQENTKSSQIIESNQNQTKQLTKQISSETSDENSSNIKQELVSTPSITINEKSDRIILNTSKSNSTISIQNSTPQTIQTLIPITIPAIPLSNTSTTTTTTKMSSNQMIKLNTSVSSVPLVKFTSTAIQQSITPKLHLVNPKTSHQKLIILPTATGTATSASPLTNNSNNLKILTVQPASLNPKICLNVPTLKTINTGFKQQINGFSNLHPKSEPIEQNTNGTISLGLKRKLSDLGKEISYTSKKNANLVCLKLDKIEDDSSNSKNGFYTVNDDLVTVNTSKKLKVVDLSFQNSPSLSEINLTTGSKGTKSND